MDSQLPLPLPLVLISLLLPDLDLAPPVLSPPAMLPHQATVLLLVSFNHQAVFRLRADAGFMLVACPSLFLSLARCTTRGRLALPEEKAS